MNETKLGQLIDQNAGRDAVHVALAPMRAAEKLQPGEHVGFVDASDKTLAGSCDTPIGIVDPYLRKPVKKDEWFFLCLYPQTTTGLRHVWEHPAFGESAQTVAPVFNPKAASIAYLEAVAKGCGLTVDVLISDAHRFNESGDVIVQQDSQRWRDNFPYPADEFWKHWEIVTGLKANHDEGIYCCTC